MTYFSTYRGAEWFILVNVSETSGKEITWRTKS